MTLAFNLVIVALVVIWVALVYWTYADAKRRVEDRFLVTCATVAALFPFIGSLIYLIVRPPEYLDDVRERELEIAAAEARLQSAGSPEGAQACPHCDERVEADFIRCPSCLRRLKEPCPSCEKALDPEWRICPWCEADPSQPTRRRTGRSRSSTTDEATPKTSGQRSTAGKSASSSRSPAAKSGSAAQRSAGRQTAKARARQEAAAATEPTEASGEPDTES